MQSFHFITTIGLMSLALAGCPRNSAQLEAQLPGLWVLTSTNLAQGNTSGQWMHTETEYRPDHTFVVRGAMGTLAPTGAVPYKTVSVATGQPVPQEETGPADGHGVWRLDRGVLYTRFTGGNWQSNVETGWEIVSLNEHELTYRRQGAEGKGPLLKATRK